ncbi:RNA polymerase sigma factor [Variovorax boronicumulans]
MLDVGNWPGSDSADMVGDYAAIEVECQKPLGSAMREYLAKNYSRLHQRLLRHLGDPDLASDSLHDAWLRLGDMAATVVVQSPEAYIYRTACNVAMDRLRRDRPWQHVDEGEAVLEYLADQSPGPDLIVEARSDVEAVERAMQHLPRRHRAVLVALRIEERTRQEVAEWHRISLRSVDTTLRQALDHCAEASGQTVMVGINSPRRGVSQRCLASNGFQ